MSAPGSATRIHALRAASAGQAGARRLCVEVFGDLIGSLVQREPGDAKQVRQRFNAAVDYVLAHAPDSSTDVHSPELIVTRAVRSFLAEGAAPEPRAVALTGNFRIQADRLAPEPPCAPSPPRVPAKCPEAAVLVDCLQALNAKQRMALKLILQRRFSIERAARVAHLPAAEVRRLLSASLQTGVDRLRLLRVPMAEVAQ